jgi:hypothetical protein
MYGMFLAAANFNQSLADWNVSRVTDMRRMFDEAKSFNQSLGNWDVSSNTDITSIFDGSGCPASEDLSRLSCGF